MNKIVNKSLAIAATKDLTKTQIRSKITEFSNSIEELTQGVADDAWSLVLMGEPGQGKTQGVWDTLQKTGVKFDGVNGTASAIGIYKFFYQHRDYDVIVIDDCDSLFESEEAANILKAATDTKAVRRVTWTKQNSNLQSIDLPNSFEMTARVIIITNKNLSTPKGKRPSKSQRIMKPILDRVLCFKTGLPNVEWELEYFTMMNEEQRILCFDEHDIPQEVRQEIIDFISDNLDHFEQISFRTIKMLCTIYNQHPAIWKEFALTVDFD